MFHISSCTIQGIRAYPITVEADTGRGLPRFSIVGLPDAAVKESRDRIRAAIINAGFSFPRGRITVNLAPADVRKQGPSLDLPIAASILLAGGILAPNDVQNCLILGELGLNGAIRSVRGVLPSALLAKACGIRRIFVPKGNAREAALIEGLSVYPCDSLQDLVLQLSDPKPSLTLEEEPEEPAQSKILRLPEIDMKDIRGQSLAKRALEIAASGHHNVLLTGPPGTGKTLLARALPGIIPTLTRAAAIEVSVIASIQGGLKATETLIWDPPFRSPHHSSSATALVGGGSYPRPGEITFAHHGVLFLDELPEFSRTVLDHLRQPLEDGYVTISRATGTEQFPASFLLIGAMNPCPCGFATHPKHTCQCTDRQRQVYQKRISGPLLDRFDLVVEVPLLDAETLFQPPEQTTSASIRARVIKARLRQQARGSHSGIQKNRDITPRLLNAFCPVTSEAQSLLKQAIDQGWISPRGHTRTLKVARTIADLASSDAITLEHIAEALSFRPTHLGQPR